MSEVELRTQHRKKLEASHPRQGAVLILWLARAAEADVDAATILRHAVGIAQIGARQVGAAVIAVDPFDATSEGYWREHFGFRSSLTKRADARWGAAQPTLDAALPRSLDRLTDAGTRPSGLSHVALRVQAELAPALVETSLGQLVRVDHGRRVDRLLSIGRGGENVSLIVSHLLYRVSASGDPI